MPTIAGRDQEIKFLEQILLSKDAEFLAMYGRRRVGKTFLISEYFKNKGIYLEVTGIKDGVIQDQLANFTESFSQCFYDGLPLKSPTSWREAFLLLTEEIDKQPKNKKIILFFDELPWLATKRSKLLQSLDYFWNTKWSRNRNIRLIVCGSAASWMLKNIIHAKGGLYNRITQKMLLKPYNLKQTKAFLKNRGITLGNKQILDIYMVMGGIPFYLKQIERGLSAAQNINRLCFNENGILFDEFTNLFQSLFDAHELNHAIVKTIMSKRYGISRNTLLTKLKMKSGGVFNSRIKELEDSGFIERFIPYGKKAKDHYYRIIDEYTIFYFKWIQLLIGKTSRIQARNYWQKQIKTPAWYAWAGYSFEEICYKHIQQISSRLELEDIGWHAGSWRYTVERNNIEKSGTQVDLLFDRDDGIITICEIKYSEKKFTIDKAYAKQLMQKLDIVEKHLKTNKDINMILITSSGLKPTVWSEELISIQINADDLFA